MIIKNEGAIAVALEKAGLGFLPDVFNIDDGVVNKTVDQRAESNQGGLQADWQLAGIIEGARHFAAQFMPDGANTKFERPLQLLCSDQVEIQFDNHNKALVIYGVSISLDLLKTVAAGEKVLEFIAKAGEGEKPASIEVPPVEPPKKGA
jgi:hypothetical protein